MGDPLSVASGVVALATFAFQSSLVLYQAVSSFQSSQRTVRELKQELEALNGALEALQETAADTDVDFTMLRLPLLRCGKACEDFQAVIAKCSAHSGGSRTSFRDWAKLRYMDEDIVGFKNMLAGYKSTILIALGDANLRRSVVTVKVLEQYKTMITDTRADLQEHLQEIDKKLQDLSQRGLTISDESVTEQQQEKDSTQQCLRICAKVASHIEQVQSVLLENVSAPPDAHSVSTTKAKGFSSARTITTNTFKNFSTNLSETTSQLESHLQSIEKRLSTMSPPGSTKTNMSEQVAEQDTIRDELASIRQCLAICSQASAQANEPRINVFEDISMADDGHQVLVSTIGDLISARRVTAGARSRQWLGQMSDDSLQQLSQSHDRDATQSPIVPQSETSDRFAGRYGAGFNLKKSDSAANGQDREYD